MKKNLALILILVTIFTLTACGGGAGDDADLYVATEVTMAGVSMDPKDVSSGGITLALDDNGKCTLVLNGEDYFAEWEVRGSAFTLTQSSDEFMGTMDGDTVTIENLLDSGMDIIFLKEGAEASEDDERPEREPREEGDEDLQIMDGDGAMEDRSVPEGKYIMTSMTSMGMEMNYADLMMADLVMELEITSDGATMSAYGESAPVEIDFSAQTMVFEGENLSYIYEDYAIIATGSTDGIDMELVFTSDSSPNWEEIGNQESSMGEMFGGDDDSTTGDDSSTGNDSSSYGDFIAPGYGSEITMPVETLSNPSTWYGTLTIENYVGDNNLDGEHEAWGYLGTTGDGLTYFELFLDEPYSAESGFAFISYYTEQHDYTFFPIADEYSWLHDVTLTEDDATWFTPSLYNGILTCTYDYDFQGESFSFYYELAQVVN